ncbi:MAG: hypothetical protein HY904_20050 [Deltaproteobacteria bacterium]|nr:hypothetical protein [Deltaproteobacteria bacterium]
MPLPPWPTPEPPSDQPTQVLGGEVALMAPPRGATWQIGFMSSFELLLRREGQLLRRHAHNTQVAMSLWAHHRLPALQAALGPDLDLLVQETAEGIQPRDAWDRRRGALLDPAASRDVFARARLDPPAVSLLGEVRTRNELQTRMASVGAPGTQLEARRSEGGVVVARAVLAVETARPLGRR